MKPLLFSFLKVSVAAIFLFLANTCSLTQADHEDDADSDTESVADTTEITNVATEQTGDYSIPKELPYSTKGTNLLIDKFYPVGWSQDGKFAYIVEPADEACGCYFFDLYIKDMISDKTIWVWNYNDEGKGDNLDKVWTKNYTIFAAQFKTNKIIQQASFRFNKPTFSYSGNQYDIIMELKLKKDTDFGFDVMKEMKINVKSKQLGTKNIYSYKEMEYAMVLHADVVGYIKSPYEDRIVVIHTEERRGYEGPPNVVYFKLTGCHLREGFEIK